MIKIIIREKENKIKFSIVTSLDVPRMRQHSVYIIDNRILIKVEFAME